MGPQRNRTRLSVHTTIRGLANQPDAGWSQHISLMGWSHRAQGKIAVKGVNTERTAAFNYEAHNVTCEPHATT